MVVDHQKDLDDIRNIIEESEEIVVHTNPDKFFEEYLNRNTHDRTLKNQYIPSVLAVIPL